MICMKKEKTPSFLLDFNGNLSILGLFNIAEAMVSNIAGEHKINGMIMKNQYNALLLLVQSKLKIIRDIPWNAEYTTISYFSNVTDYTMDICVEFRNPLNEIYSVFKTQACVLDIETKSIRELSTVGITSDFPQEPDTTELRFKKWISKDLELLSKIEVRNSNIDFNGHTHNTEYIRFLMDTYEMKDLQENPIQDVEINFCNQSFEHDQLSILKKTNGDTDEFAIQKNKKNIVKCKILRVKGHNH